MMKSDEELEKTYSVSIGKDDIFHLTVFKIERDSSDNARSTELAEQAFLNLVKKNPEKKYNWLINITPCGKLTFGFSRESRRIATRIAKNKNLGKVGVITQSIFLRTLIGFVSKAAGKDEDIRLFPDKEKALKWLKEK